MMLWISPFLLLLGLYLPGMFIARRLHHSLWWASAFPISLIVLFHSVFWPGVLGIPVTLWTVLPCLVAVAVGFAWLGRAVWLGPRPAIAPKPAAGPGWIPWDRILLCGSGLVGAILVARVATSPLIGFDTLFRWDYLAQQLLSLRNFGYYPPLAPADFRTYFYVDGIPPLVSFTHWWMYASVGRRLPWLISVFVGAQFAVTLAFTYGAAAALFSRRAGVLAAATLAACPLYFRSVVLGQETGLTALAIAATLYFAITAREAEDTASVVSAGLAAALCALSREYGWIAPIAGGIVLLWKRHAVKQVVIFAATCAAAAGPWYLRNWLRTGNPFYSLSFGDFAVNPIHNGIMQRYQAALGVGHWTAATWTTVLWLLASLAAFQILAGIPGCFAGFRRHGYLAMIAVLLVGIWLQSAGYTSAGIETSTRVLSPALAVLSVAGAGVLEKLTRRARWYKAIGALIVLGQMLTAGHGMSYPNTPSAMTLSEWSRNAFRPVPEPLEFQIRDELARMLPAGSRVLSDNAYLHAALIEKGIEVVPVWSPEVRFLFSAAPEEAERRLKELHIASVVYYPRSMNTDYLVSTSPLYRSLPRRWRVTAQLPGILSVLVPGDR